MAEASTYSNILTKGYRASLDDLELDEGKLRFTEDTGELFLDLDDKRIQISRDVETSKTESQILASTAAFEKIYLSSDTHRLYYPEIGESTVTWNCVGEENASSVDYATNAGTADYATNAGTANYATNAGTASSATNADTATYATNAGTATYPVSAKIYSCRIWENNTLVRDFIPVRIGTVGYLYDEIGGGLYGNSVTGDFVLGADV